jgi:lipopolysaccharide/colanic/teichoic acid biosynthesis glycosyltransferase
MAMQLLDSRPVEVVRGQFQYIGKRLLDIVGSLIALILVAPLFLVIMILVRLDSPGPAIFRQKRVGKEGKLFTCLKFRTMYYNNDDTIHRSAFRRFAAGYTLSDDPQSRFKMVNDSRITTLGKWLRRTSLDELPQFINVLCGEMSLVGPRPAIPYELENYKDWHHQRYGVKPGLTGMWQVHGRSRVGFDEMMRLDVQYATGWTIWLDIKLLALTIPAVIMQRGAR